MVDNTTINVGSGGDSIRDLARQGGTVKTQVVALDLGGVAGNPEYLVDGGQAPMSMSLPVTTAFDQPSDPALIAIVNLLTRLFPQTDSIFSPFQELAANIKGFLADGFQALPFQGTWINRSTSLTTAGLSQFLMPVNVTRKALFIQNPGTAAGQNIAAVENVYINYTNAAGVADGVSIELGPGAIVPIYNNVVTQELINFNATTAGHRIIAREML